ncbi:MAG: orotate phosphoribosyltransferase [Sphingomonadales bacterium]|nr:orotate phosphoribosyltransferase [Sphingomonadales bacterium]
MNPQQTAEQIAKLLLKIKAVSLSPKSPFKWASGWLSPIYCDNRLTLGEPHTRSFIADALSHHIQQNMPYPKAIAGVATAAIPQAALVADRLQLPMLYVRPEPKQHGRGQQIEGQTFPGSSVVLIEDLISTGGSSLKAALAVQEAGMKVLSVVSVFTYGFEQAKNLFDDANIPCHSLCDYPTLLTIARELGEISPEEVTILNQWRDNPGVWTGT